MYSGRELLLSARNKTFPPLHQFFLPFLLLISLIALPLKAEVASIPEQRLVDISNSTLWWRLNYYESALSGVKSRVASKEFFLSEKGDSDPLSELLASIEAFQSEKALRDEQTAQCLYPARYAYLKEQLKEHLTFSDQECKRFREWTELLAVSSVTLIYPSSYQNNPASMFGHTLLRLDQADQSEKTRMLAYSVNYAAETGGAGGLVYAVAGIFGGFNGYFSISPYYKMLERYSDLESRDIWEYQLELSKEEIDRMLAHLWELRGTPFTYYYFDENCSYQLLNLLEVAKPESDFTSRFKIHVIPVDTVRSVLEEDGSLQATHFRPSIGTKIQKRAGGLSPKLRKATQRYISGDKTAIESLSDSEKAAVLDLAYELIDFQRLKTSGDTADAERMLLSILKARSKLPQSTDSPVALYEAKQTSPHRGHRTTRSRLAYHYEYNESALRFEVRPAYHDVLDTLAGYTAGFGIDFLDTSFSIDESGTMRLDRMIPLQVESLTPWNDFFKPFSWRFLTGVHREYFEREESSLQYNTELALGLSFQTPIGVFSLMPEIQLPVSSHYEDGVDTFSGVYIGLLESRNTTGFRMEGRSYVSLLHESELHHELKANFRLALSTNHSIRFAVERFWKPDFNFNSVGVSYDYFW